MFFILLIGACSEPEAKENLKIFRYNQPSAVYSLDPAFSKDQGSIWIANQIFEGLVKLNDQMEIVPSLAESWSVSKDGLVYTFKLRPEVSFHQASNDAESVFMTAADVVYSFNRLIDPTLAAPGSWVFNGKVRKQNPFVAIDPLTLEIHLEKPFQPILGILSMQYCSVVSEAAVKNHGKDFRSKPIGTGPFKLASWRENELLLLKKNPSYWGKSHTGKSLPFLDGIRITFTENKKNAFLKFRDGELDFLSGLDPSYQDEILNPSGQLSEDFKAKANLQRTAYLNTEYLGFLMNKEKNPILSNPKIRQAINYGFDRDKMIRYLRKGIGVPAKGGFVPPSLLGLPTNTKHGYNYNPDKARQLIKEANYKIDDPQSEILLETTASYVDLCTFLQKALGEIGLKVKLEQAPSSHLREKMRKEESGFFRGSWIADYPDAESYLSCFYGQHPAPPNYTRFSNVDFDRWYQLALVEANPSKRRQLYLKMDSCIIANAPLVPLFYDEVLRFSSKKVNGLGINGLNQLHLSEVYLTD